MYGFVQILLLQPDGYRQLVLLSFCVYKQLLVVLVASQGDVSRKLNHAFLLVDSFNFNFVDDERSDICVIEK